MRAPKLKPGDKIRVIAPSGSYMTPWITEEFKKRAKQRVEAMGLVVTFGKHLDEIDDFCSSSIESRIEDLHDAFADPEIKLVSTARGGFNSHQLFKSMDFDLIKKNPKLICGFSDITALAHAIYVKTGLVTYSGPNYCNFGHVVGTDYTTEYFKKCMFSDEPFDVSPSKEWFDASPVKHTEAEPPCLTLSDPAKAGESKGGPAPIKNIGPIVIRPGTAEGRLIGANICTMNMLQGTEYFPDLTDSILFMEDDYESQGHHFNSHLQSMILLPQFKGVKGIVIGRFEKKSGMNDDLIRKTIATYPELNNLPMIANADFGHTQPMCTFPIGGRVRIEGHENGSSKITILEH